MHISLIAVLIGALIAGGLYWLGRWLIGVMGPPDPFSRIALIALALICVLIFLGFALGRIALPSIGF